MATCCENNKFKVGMTARAVRGNVDTDHLGKFGEIISIHIFDFYPIMIRYADGTTEAFEEDQLELYNLLQSATEKAVRDQFEVWSNLDKLPDLSDLPGLGNIPDYIRYAWCVSDGAGDSISIKKGIMHGLRTIPARLKRALNSNLRKMYQVGWLDSELDITPEGALALREFLFDKFEEELGKKAAEEIAEYKKSQK